MALGNVQLRKIVFVIFDLRAFHHLITHAYKDPLQFLQGDGVGMTMAYIGLFGRESHINNLCLHLRFPGFSGQSRFRLLQPGLDQFSRFIDHLSHFGPLFGSYILHAFQHTGQFSLFPEIRHADLV